ncbi:enoyl-CoA hydratase/isomerase family protein [Frankia sp. AgPm24]|uniref:enoyl-CoA hydratase/isomerase family protein n=1 Tax=Frankia sp. AgPm24 TaxID=631128 RepID=UPI00200C03AD|nr:enoyl-CoA hydratase/isomerase family protein [Frankia sp. AgPm24]MCK9924649.1 enoyl-CoA hydratase/isomerase family protein [Frankia sp. AgPm24]
MTVPAAAAPAAAGLRVDVLGPAIRIRLQGRADPDQLGVAGFTLSEALRRLTGDIRIAVVVIDAPAAAVAAASEAPTPGHRTSTQSTPTQSTSDQPPADQLGLDGLLGWRRALERLASAPDLISVAALSGWTGDVGASLAASCDLRILTTQAGLRLEWATRWGLLPAAGALTDLARLTGPAVALDLSLTGRPLGAAEALRIGLAQRVVPAPRLDAELAAVEAALLAVPPETAAETKALLRPRGSVTVNRSLGPELQAWQRLLSASDDLAAG